jgi:hypothetical protein
LPAVKRCELTGRTAGHTLNDRGHKRRTVAPKTGEEDSRA